MNIIIHSPRLNGGRHLTLHHRGAAVALFASLFLLPVTAVVLGFVAGERYVSMNPSELEQQYQERLAEQEARVEEARQEARNNLDALAMKLGEMQAQMIRLNALGERLTQMADLDGGEFQFGKVPGQGGPESSEEARPVAKPDFMKALGDLSQQLDSRSRQLSVLEGMMMNRNLQDEVLPAGRPIRKGWRSSHYGMRTDPFNGNREFHKGMDFAGREGSDVIATASGVVTWAGSRWGYGNLVEINHGNGVITRYGHNAEILVEVGDTVEQGEAIALMGSTGRSTGPHVHFEVWEDGDTVDPASYIRRANR
ncbi:Peptidase family M23 [Thiohalospira halophila DSM 15071]|uniref:Peptidase family M23 n=1 Tax=Thiohalospira halophila DSM 15071 TaxID=1123397 RepID=A0A1I1QRZ1_9GAMM|nr:peptidoglycan DD-metalloendopeptidase family protein [Thiohalospira halophila]SFD24782.1 Peptidase family M23 [Thiohalospira halophila DSM 15071]